MPKDNSNLKTQNTQSTIDSKEGEKVDGSRNILSQYRTLIKVFFLSVLIIFFLLPALIILLSSVWPSVFPGTSSLKTLSDNFTKVLGVISLILGGVSIYLAVKTDKVFQEQKRQQDNFMSEIRSNTRRVDEKLEKLLYDDTKDKSGGKIKPSSEANEDEI